MMGLQIVRECVNGGSGGAVRRWTVAKALDRN